MAIGVPVDWSLQRMNPLQAGGYYPGDIRDEPPAPMRDFETWAAARRLPGRPEEGIYFPAIAENVGRGAVPVGPGVPVSPGAVVRARELPWSPAPTDYYPDIANNVGGGMPPAASAPGPAPSMQDIGPGIPVEPGPQVSSVDLPAQAMAPAAVPGGMGGYNPRDIYSALTAPGPPPSRRYSSTRPEFIFTNPAAAQQAASNYAARLGYESGQDQGYQRYQGQLASEREATQRSAQATEAARANEATRLSAIAKEGEATRQSNERIAGMSALMAQYQRAEQDWLQNERNRAMAESLARQKNANPDAKIDPRYITLGPDGKTWVASPAFAPRARPKPPTFQGWQAGGLAYPEEQPAMPQPAEPVPQTAQAGPAVPAAQPEYNMAEGSGVTGWRAYTPTGALWNLGVKAWPYTPTGMVVNRIVGAFRPSTPAAAPALPAQ